VSLFFEILNFEILMALINFKNRIILKALDPLKTSELIWSNTNPNGKVDMKSIQNHDASYILAISHLSYVTSSSSISTAMLKFSNISRVNMIVNGKSSILVSLLSANTISYGDYKQMNNNITEIKLIQDK
jgi:hypothetical protein